MLRMRRRRARTRRRSLLRRSDLLHERIDFVWGQFAGEFWHVVFAVAQQHIISTLGRRLQADDLRDVHECRTVDGQETVWRQFGGHRCEGSAKQVRSLSNVQFHAPIDRLHPLDISQSQKEYEPVGVQTDPFLLTGFLAEAIQQFFELPWRQPLERGEASAGTRPLEAQKTAGWL